MLSINNILKAVAALALILLFLAIKVFIGIAIISLAIVPITFLYCVVTNKSYNSVIDSSGVLYTLNKVGQWAYISAAALIIFYLMFKF